MAPQNTTSKSGEREPGAKRQSALLEKNCAWIVGELLDGRDVTRRAFEENMANRLKAAPSTSGTDWSYASRAVCSVLTSLGYAVEIDQNKRTIAIIGESQLAPKHAQTKYFDPYADWDQKDRIGDLVANFLWYVRDRHALLGSGSTVYHVARNMTRIARMYGSLYPQLFWTVNVAVAAYFCQSDDGPLSSILIPQGMLRTATFRYSSMQQPDWFCPIAVVGADGCYFDPKNKRPDLYANESTVADNTNLFMRRAVDSVVCCIASAKLDYDSSKGQNAGPPIESPVQARKDPSVSFYLVTDSMPKRSEKIKALEEQGWKVVTELRHWPEIDRLGAPPWHANDKGDPVSHIDEKP